jgi:uncharacterized protein YbbC (DUF1343 family)
MRTGLDQLLSDPDAYLGGRRIGLVSHASGTTKDLQAGVDALHRHPSVHLVTLFGAEHGLRGEVPAGDFVPDGHDRPTGLPLISLYGPRRAPTPEQLRDVDLLVIDFQDIGSRYYTFISTTITVIGAALAARCPVLVLDRPNPLGGLAQAGNVLPPDALSFVGALPIPMQHGLTLAELVRWHFRAEMANAPEAIRIIPVEGWVRAMTWEQLGLPWVPPSPNSTGPAMARLYPGTCLLEGTNLSEGRGTPYPFELAGAPFIDPYRWAERLNAWNLPGVRFRPVTFRPTASKFAGDVVHGVQIHQVRPEAVRGTLVGFALIAEAMRLWPDDVHLNDFFRLLAGDANLPTLLGAGRSPWDIEEAYLPARRHFADSTRPYWLYPAS